MLRRRVHVDIHAEIAAQTREPGNWIRMNRRGGHIAVLTRKPVGEGGQTIGTTLRERKLRLVAGTYQRGTI